MRARHGALAVWLLVWIVAASLDICLPLKFWSHYFLALIPPLCICVSLAVALLLEWRPARLGPALAVILIGVLMVPPGRTALAAARDLSKRIRDDVPRKVAADIMRLGPGQGVYVYDYQPIIYFLTGTKPPTRYVLPVELADFAVSSGAHPMAEIARIMAQHPRFVVTADPAYGETPSSDMQGELARDLLSYRKVKEYTDPNDGHRIVSLFMAAPRATPVSLPVSLPGSLNVAAPSVKR
jgi:hypothetical protein